MIRVLLEPIRQLLAMKERMEAKIKIEDGCVRTPGRLPTLEELAGSLPPLLDGMAIEDVIKQVKLEHYMQLHTSLLLHRCQLHSLENSCFWEMNAKVENRAEMC